MPASNQILQSILVSLVLLTVGTTALAQSRTINLDSLGFSWVQWSERARIASNDSVVQTTSQLYGQKISYTRESFRGDRGLSFESGLHFGGANATSNNLSLTYQASQINYWGISQSIRTVFRPEPQVTLSLGPDFIYRSLTFPIKGSITQTETGSSINISLLLDLRYRLNRKWEVQHAVGAMLIKANTYTSIGFGYKF